MVSKRGWLSCVQTSNKWRNICLELQLFFIYLRGGREESVFYRRFWGDVTGKFPWCVWLESMREFELILGIDEFFRVVWQRRIYMQLIEMLRTNEWSKGMVILNSQSRKNMRMGEIGRNFHISSRILKRFLLFLFICEK